MDRAVHAMNDIAYNGAMLSAALLIPWWVFLGLIVVFIVVIMIAIRLGRK